MKNLFSLIEETARNSPKSTAVSIKRLINDSKDLWLKSNVSGFSPQAATLPE